MRKASFLCIFTLFLVFSGTSASTGQAGAFEPTGKWDKTNVRVCWLTPEVFNKSPGIVDDTTLNEGARIFFDETLTIAIQKKIKQEYTRLKTGIHFTGWKKCVVDSRGKLKNADAILALNPVDEYAGVIEGDSSVGLSINDWMESRHLRREEDSVSRPTVAIHLPPESLYPEGKVSFTDAVLLTAVHEFGHLAGLHHEHMAFVEEALADESCKSTQFGQIFKSDMENARKLYSQEYLENLELRLSWRTTYDSASMMSYCRLFQILENGISNPSLSGGDRAILLSIYSDQK